MSSKRRLLPTAAAAGILAATLGGPSHATAIAPAVARDVALAAQASAAYSSNVRNAAFQVVRDQNVGRWAIGTFRGKNSGNGVEETITINPDGSAELRTRDAAPKYGTFAGETLTFGTRVNRVKDTRGGIVIDGSYYYRRR